MLQNADLPAKIGADTAENERNFAEKLPNIGNILLLRLLGQLARRAAPRPPRRRAPQRRRRGGAEPQRPEPEAVLRLLAHSQPVW